MLVAAHVQLRLIEGSEHTMAGTRDGGERRSRTWKHGASWQQNHSRRLVSSRSQWRKRCGRCRLGTADGSPRTLILLVGYARQGAARDGGMVVVTDETVT